MLKTDWNSSNNVNLNFSFLESTQIVFMTSWNVLQKFCLSFLLREKDPAFLEKFNLSSYSFCRTKTILIRLADLSRRKDNPLAKRTKAQKQVFPSSFFLLKLLLAFYNAFILCELSIAWFTSKSGNLFQSSSNL